MFSSKSFTVSGLIFQSLIHFEFIFVYRVRKCPNFILLHIVVVLPSPLLKILSLTKEARIYNRAKIVSSVPPGCSGLAQRRSSSSWVEWAGDAARSFEYLRRWDELGVGVWGRFLLGNSTIIIAGSFRQFGNTFPRGRGIERNVQVWTMSLIKWTSKHCAKSPSYPPRCVCHRQRSSWIPHSCLAAATMHLSGASSVCKLPLRRSVTYIWLAKKLVRVFA